MKEKELEREGRGMEERKDGGRDSRNGEEKKERGRGEEGRGRARVGGRKGDKKVEGDPFLSPYNTCKPRNSVPSFLLSINEREI
jgi:hypothetical protein